MLRYDLLSKSFQAAENASPHSRSKSYCTINTDDTEKIAADDTDESDTNTNLDELKWFQHRWLDKHGKSSDLKEYREKMVLLRRWFESLDTDGSGEVGLDELEDPLVSVGLARSRDDVRKLIEEVDSSGSGEVNFHEFLHMMSPKTAKRPRTRAQLHTPKRWVLSDAKADGVRSSTAPAGVTKGSSSAESAHPANPVVKLFAGSVPSLWYTRKRDKECVYMCRFTVREAWGLDHPVPSLDHSVSTTYAIECAYGGRSKC